MAPEADLSLATDYTCSENGKDSPSSNSSRKKTATIHQHTRPRLAGETEKANGRPVLYCRYCTTYSSPITTNFRTHLLRRHGISSESRNASAKIAAGERLRQIWDEALAKGATEEVESLVLQKVMNRDVSRQAIIELIVIENLPFSIVQTPQFHTFCASLNPKAMDFLPTSHSTISSMLQSSFQESQDIVRKKLQSALTDIHLSVDIWTSPNNYLFLAVCAHFIDDQEDLQKVLLSLRTVAGHSGEEQWDSLLPVLIDYGITRKIGAVTADNSGTNDTLCRKMSDYFKEQEGIEWNATAQRIRCHGHILNLAVQAFLFEGSIDVSWIEFCDNRDAADLTEGEQKENMKAFRAMGVLGRLHNVIAHSRSSAGRTAQFVKHVGRRIPLDNRTRWNSWYNLLDVALEKEAGINEYIKSNLDSLSNDSLSPRDWVSLRMLHQFLQPFKSATLKTQGDCARLDRVLFAMDVLLKHIETSRSEYKQNKDLAARIQICWEKYTEYYNRTEDSPLYAAALILNPSRRLAYIKKWWETEWQTPAIDAVKNLWQGYRTKHPVPDPTPLYSGDEVIECEDATSVTKLDAFDRIGRDFEMALCGAYPGQEVDEFDEYASGIPSALPKGISPLRWWCQDNQRVKWPNLSRFAIDVLSIPAMSDEPERIFSGGRRTVSWERMSLGPDTIQHTECLKSWLHSEILQ